MESEPQKPVVDVKVTFVGFGDSGISEEETKLKLFGKSKTLSLSSSDVVNSVLENSNIPRDPRLGRNHGCYSKYTTVPDYPGTSGLAPGAELG